MNSNLRLVIISLSRGMGRMIQNGLASFDVEVRTYTRIEQALKDILSDPPHAVLVDDALRAAFNIAAAVRQKLPTIGLVLLARGMTRDKVLNAAQSGINRVVVRPFAMTTLLDQTMVACQMAGNDGAKLVPASEEVIDRLLEAPDGKAVLDQLKRVETLEAVPHVIERVLSLAQNPDSGATEMERVVKGDSSIAAMVLKRANSSYYSTVHKITRVRDAITRIGFSNVRNMVLGLFIMELASGSQGQGSLDMEEFWKASLATAILSREYAKHFDVPEMADAFVIGLLADFGCIVLDEHLPEKLEQAISLSHRERISLFQAERRILGVTHAQVGGLILNRWGLPIRVVQVVGTQSTPLDTSRLSPEDKQMSSAVWLACWTVQGLGLGNRAELLFGYPPSDMLRDQDIGGLITDQFIADLVQEINEMLQLFHAELGWPCQDGTQQTTIHYYESSQPSFSPLELIIRRIGAQPVRLDSVEALEELPPDSTTIVSLGGLEELQSVCRGTNWGDRFWLFVLPRGQVPPDNGSKLEAGIPHGNCRYDEYPFIIDDLTIALAQLGAGIVEPTDAEDGGGTQDENRVGVPA